MHVKLLLVSLACVAGLSAKPPKSGGGAVTVNFVRPEKFTDVQLQDQDRSSSRAILLPDLRKFLVRTGASILPKGASLDLQITDIDDAGRMALTRRGNRRVNSRDYPARIEFTWTYKSASGNKQGKERLTQNEKLGPENPGYGSMPTVKYALVDWMKGVAR